MVTKRIYQRVLKAAAVVAIGFGMASCVDNIDNSTTPGEQEQQAQEAQQTQKAQKFWSVVSQLVDVDDYTDDYADMTFESTYGVSQGGDESTRYVYTNTAAAAAARFADLVEVDDIDENTQSYTYDDPDVGKLVYTKGSGRILATVDVSIKQIPTLKKIVYVPGAYANGSFQGRAYYRFGDVVARKNINYDNFEFTEYWICVRPSFGPESKGDSHWVCLNMLPKKNVWHYLSDTNSNNYWLPKGLGTNKEHMQNLAEMLYALANPQTWRENVNQYARNGQLEMFHDFDAGKADLHNEEFWKIVRRKWTEKDIFSKAFNMDAQTAWNFLSDNPSLHLLYYGHSWWTNFSWNCTLNEAVFENGNAAKEKNMHKATYKEVTRDMRQFEMDCRKMGADNYDRYKTFFTDKPAPEEEDQGDGIYRWTVRHATGKELSSNGTYNKKEKIPGVEDVYRYYADVIENANLDEEPEVTPIPKNVVENAVEGKGAGTYLPGDVVKDEDNNYWFCLQGSAYSEMAFPNVTDKSAWFLTFDFNGLDTTGDTVAGLPTEDELPVLAFRLGSMLGVFNGYSEPLKFNFDPAGDLGSIMKHIKTYTGIDWHHLILPRDSVWRFTSQGKTYDSKSTNVAFCLAYNDGSGRQAIARVIIDRTQAGTHRTSCNAYNEAGQIIGRLEDPRILLYKHYESYIPDLIRQPTAVETYLGMNTWCLPWDMTGQKMYLDDVTDEELLNMHAWDDKWVTLPLTGDASQMRRLYRQEVEHSSKPAHYIGHYNTLPSGQMLSMFNEPVLFLRVMKVTDNGGPQPNLVSQDGRHLSVVHLQDDLAQYGTGLQYMWAGHYKETRSTGFFLDNVQTALPTIQGLDD